MSGGARRPTPFALAVSLASLLVTLVVAAAIWGSYFPDHEGEALRERRAYYEKHLRNADVSWREGLYYRVMDGAPGKR